MCSTCGAAQDGQLPQKVAELEGHREVAALLAARHAERATSPQGSRRQAATRREDSGVVGYPSAGAARTAAEGNVSYPSVRAAPPPGDGVVSYPSVGPKAEAEARPRPGAAAATAPAAEAAVPSAPPLSSMGASSGGGPAVEAQWDLQPYEEAVPPRAQQPRSHRARPLAAAEGAVSYPSMGTAASRARTQEGSAQPASGDAPHSGGGGRGAMTQPPSAFQQNSSGVVGYPSVGAAARRPADTTGTAAAGGDADDWGDPSPGEDLGWGEPVGLIRSDARRQPAPGRQQDRQQGDQRQPAPLWPRQGDQRQAYSESRRRQEGGGSDRQERSAPGCGAGASVVPQGTLKDRGAHASAASVLAAQRLAQQEGRIAQLTTQLDQLQMSLAAGGGSGRLQRAAAPDVFCCPITQARALSAITRNYVHVSYVQACFQAQASDSRVRAKLCSLPIP